MVGVETSRLLLRRWRDEDLEPYARICADQEAMRYMTRGPVPREQAARSIERYVRHWGERGYGLWAAEEKASGAFVGRIGLSYHDDWTAGAHKTEAGWLLDRGYWGRGFATEGALASVRHGFEALGLRRIISIIQPANLASRRVAENAGLTARGETRWRGIDVVWYAIDREEWRAKPEA